MDDPDTRDTSTQCMDVYKENFQYDGSPNKFILRIVVRGDFQNK